MTHKTKYLSYFWNSSLNKSRLKENKIYQNAKRQDSGLNLLGYILFSLIMVVSISSGLRIVEQVVFQPHPSEPQILAVKIVMAAENANQAELFHQSHQQVNIKPGEAFTFNLSFKNTGATTWTKDSVYLKSSTTALKFRHDFWPDPYLPATLQETTVNPGETGTFKFALQAPKNIKLYSGEFVLVNENVLIKGGEVIIKMNVVTNPEDYQIVKEVPAIIPTPTVVTTVTNSNELKTEPDKPKIQKTVCNLNLNIASIGLDSLDNLSCIQKFNIPENGPDIEIGLFHTDEMITIRNTKAWQIYDDKDILLASVPANQLINFNFIEAKGEYAFDFIDKTIRTTSDLNLQNFGKGIFEIVSYKDIPSWNKNINYNLFQGDLRIKLYDKKERVWVTETVPLEQYLKGIKETSEGNPIEYQKAMTIAARTYALYHVNKFKVQDSFFDLYPDERDQVYKGYQAELIMPTQSSVVDETRGVVATYGDEIIVAYYSARSGGQTINYNNIPYLKAVETPYTAGQTLYGHGIGIDQQDAKARADKDNWTFDQILRYYYTNIDIEKIY